MKERTLLAAITCFFAAGQAQAIRHYNEGDTLYVWAQSGLVLRMEPDFKSEKIASLPYGTTVVAQWHKGWDEKKESAVEAILPCTFEGQHYQGFKIPGTWLQVIANGKTGYVFDGYLSKYPPLRPGEHRSQDLDQYLNRAFGLASQVKDMGTSIYTAKLDCNFYKNGASRQSRGVGDGLSITTYILPELSLEEGYLIANHFFNLEKHTNRIPTNLEESDFFLKISSPYFLDFDADKTKMPKYVRIGCVNGVVTIIALYSC